MIEAYQSTEGQECFGIVPQNRLNTARAVVGNTEKLLQVVVTTNPKLSQEAKTLLQYFVAVSEKGDSQETTNALPKTIQGVFTRLRQLGQAITVLETHGKFYGTYNNLKNFSLQGYQVLHVRAVELCIQDVHNSIDVAFLDVSQLQMISELIVHLLSELQKCMQDEPCAFGYLVTAERARGWSAQLRVIQESMVSCLETKVSRESFSDVLFLPE
jgi:hypothetical protein